MTRSRSAHPLARALLASLMTVSASLLSADALAQGSLGNIVFAPAEQDTEPVDPTDRFPAGVEVVYAFFEFKNLGPTDIVGGVWYRGDEIVLSQASTLSQVLRTAETVPAGKLYFAITFDEGAPAGAYRLELTLNSVPVRSGTFTVEAAAEEPVGARATPVAAQAPSLPLTCETTAQAIEGGPGTTVTGTCPANCSSYRLWGTDTYTDDSPICYAALHAGVVPLAGGPVTITIRAGQASYEGTTRNGITSSPYGSWSRSFTVAAPGPGADRGTAPSGAPAGGCSAPLDYVTYRNQEHGYCIAHQAHWAVAVDGDNVTFEIPEDNAPERMGVHLSAMRLEEEMPLDDALDVFLDSFLPELRNVRDLQVGERTHVVVAGREARLVGFDGRVEADAELFDMVGRIYLLAGDDQRLYALVFVMDTTRIPLESYLPTLDAMLESFALVGTAAR